MASLGPSATAEDIEEELIFMDVLIGSLDPDADDYHRKIQAYSETKRELENRLQELQSQPGPQVRADVDGTAAEQDEFWLTTLDGRPPNGDGYLHESNALKRSLTNDHDYDSHQHRSKRQTPVASNAVTPTSSVVSFELSEKPDIADRARARHLQAEAAFRREHEIRQADEQFARNLSEQHGQVRPPSGLTSYSRPGVQTIFNPNGSLQRLPSVKSELMPAVSPKQKYPAEQQLAQRPRERATTIDLTGSDDEDNDVTEIAPNKYTINSQLEQRRQQGVMPKYAMPGAFPGMNGTSPYGSINRADERGRQYYGTMREAQPKIASAVTSRGYAPSSDFGKLSELNHLISGSSSSRPYLIDEDDDLAYEDGGQQYFGFDPFNSYAGQDELYRLRFDTLAAYDPAKTKEEINALLQNIRADEEMPEHLRVHTPEAMAVKLHKYQELGLTWLKNCEEGSNKGGILADDMGLGKTIQMLSLLVSRRSEDPRCKTTLVVAPVALMRQWKQEIKFKIKPGSRHCLNVYTHHGQRKKKSFSDLQIYDVVLTTYGSIAAEVKKLEAFRLRQRHEHDARPNANEKCALIGDDAKWYRVILDEAQCIKNRGTQTAKAAYHLNAKYRFCMTGTPMMNSVDELFSPIHFLRIKPYSTWEKFRADFVQPLRQDRDELRQKSMRMLQTLCKAIMLRRTKQSTFEGKPILVLPERTTEIDNPEFDEDEKQFYSALEQRTKLQFNKYLRNGAVGKSYTAILVLLLRLRQACCHPHLIKDFGVSASANISTKEMMKFAEELHPHVITRIKEKEGNFECPVCYDAATNPAIFIPCGHDMCSDCFARLTDPANAVADGNENGSTKGKCPECRGEIDSKHVIDFDSFKRVHQRELLNKEELESIDYDAEEIDGEESSEDEESAMEDEDEVDGKGNLKNFVVEDGEKSETDGEASPEDPEDHGDSGPSTRGKKTPYRKSGSKLKKTKGKERKRDKTAVTLADLKKLANRNAAARKAYLRRLNKDWVSSAKIDKTLEILQTIMDRNEGEKVLVFSQWTSLLDLLEIPIYREGWGYRRYDGSMHPRMRGDAVDDFRDDHKGVRIMLVSLKAGNAGLNLNMANQVIILDPFWNPYIEEQAIDRAHRLGQTKPVKVHRVLVEGTVEDRIIALQEKKRALISEALDEKAGQSIARLGVQELAYLFGVTHNPNQAVQ